MSVAEIIEDLNRWIEMEHGLKEQLQKGTGITIKIGYDPTAENIHLGHLCTLIPLRKLQHHGYVVTVLMGSFTATIGDPEGRANARQSIDPETVRQNAAVFLAEIQRILQPEKTKIVFNHDWLENMNLKRAMTEMMQLMTTKKLNDRSCVQARTENGAPMTVAEFIYPLLQAYDSVHMRANIEAGGADQEFNIGLGRELQHKHGQDPQAMVLFKLLIAPDGAKMGKSNGPGAIKVFDRPEELYGKIMSLPDSILPNYMMLLCPDIPRQEIDNMSLGLKAGSIDPMKWKKRLAFEIVKLANDLDTASRAQQIFERQVQRKEAPESVPQVLFSDLTMANTIPLFKIIAGLGFSSSGSHARRLIDQGAVKIDGIKVEENDMIIQTPEDSFRLQVGKREFADVRPPVSAHS